MSFTTPILDDHPPSNGIGGIHNPSSASPPSGTASNLLGLGLTPNQSPSVLTSYPHLGHYIFNLLQSIQTSPPRSALQHPLSVSSSGSDDELGASEGDFEQKTPQRHRERKSNGVDRDGLVRKIVELLDNEEEDEVKNLLRPHMGDLAKVILGKICSIPADGWVQDEILMDQVCLDCMHRRRGEFRESLVRMLSIDIHQTTWNIYLMPHTSPPLLELAAPLLSPHFLSGHTHPLVCPPSEREHRLEDLNPLQRLAPKRLHCRTARLAWRAHRKTRYHLQVLRWRPLGC